MTSLGANRVIVLMLVVALVIVLAGCGSKGGYYKDDGPPRGISKSDIEKIPDAVPKS